MIIYLISSEINNNTLYKIGITRQTVADRLKQLKTGNPATLTIINQFESKWAFKIETNLHITYHNKNVSGSKEWFRLDERDINEFITKCEELDKIFEMLSINNTWIIDNSILKR